ncbi:MAG TPA: pseudouridine synthase, partial [Nitrospirota bacterium]|nr:pseudouridine synthase [Nitrospirota bacterium]
MLERLQKIISAAGITSRRAAEELIAEGRVRVNGKVVTALGTKADAFKDHIKVDGKLVNPKQPATYLMLNKPPGFVTTMSDPEGRPTVQDLLKGVKIRVYPVGRLDYNSEGLLLLTNDGDFAHLITHPKHEFPKTYLAKVKGVVEDKFLNELEKGVFLDDGKTAPAKIKKVRKEEANSWLEITIHEGRKRQVRRMFDRIGHSVIKLRRIRTGNLSLGDLPEGAYRYLTPIEVKGLREASEISAAKILQPARGSRKLEISSRDPKPAHRGRTADARPGRAGWLSSRKSDTKNRRLYHGMKSDRHGSIGGEASGYSNDRSRVSGQGSRGIDYKGRIADAIRPAGERRPDSRKRDAKSKRPYHGMKNDRRGSVRGAVSVYSNDRSRVSGQGSRGIGYKGRTADVIKPGRERRPDSRKRDAKS